MQLRDTAHGYGLVSRALHWSMAVAIVALFALGYWMVGLDYYNPYYTAAPDLHKSVGMVVLVALVGRVAWRLINPKPDDSGLATWERYTARAVHWSFYGLLAAITISGYLISTGDGRSIDMFGLFEVPSIIEVTRIEEPAGYIHWLLSYCLMALAVLHSAAALKHHLVDRTPELVRMWRGPPKADRP